MAFDPWINFGIEGWAQWPARATEMQFDGRDIHMLPPDREHYASVHVQVKRSRLDEIAAQSLVNRFLSALSWCHDQPINLVSGFSGNPKPIPVPRDGRAKDPVPIYPLSQTSPRDPKRRLALALFREARSINSVAYSFLGYFKIVGIVCQSGREHESWINSRLTTLRSRGAKERVRELSRSHPNVGAYLYQSGRCAVAHAYSEPLVDPDDAEHLGRLRSDLPIVRELAIQLMEQDFGLGRNWFDENCLVEERTGSNGG